MRGEFVTPFAGFSKSDFETPVGEVPAALEALAQTLPSKLPKQARSRLAELRLSSVGPGAVEQMPDDPPSEDAVVRLAIGQQGLAFALDAPCGRPAEAFLTWVEDTAALRELSGLEDFSVLALEARPANSAARYTGKRPKWSVSPELIERVRLEAAEFDDDTRDGLFAICRGMDGKWEKAALSLYRTWSSDQLMSRKADSLDEVVAAVQAIAPIGGRLNYLARQAKAVRAPALERAPWRAPD